MKKHVLLIVTGFIICTAFHKPKDTICNRTAGNSCTDYRDAYTGSYFCHSSSTMVNPEEGPKKTNSTLTINVSKDALDSILQITIGTNTHKFKLKSEKLYAYPDGEHRNGKFFATDSISMYMSYGRASSSVYIGKKI